MSRRAAPKLEKLLKAMDRTGGMTRSEMVTFLVGGKRNYDSYSHRDTYNSSLYGTATREGILERFCRKDARNGKWVVKQEITAPYTPVRA
jgi:hypothetical protein